MFSVIHASLLADGFFFFVSILKKLESIASFNKKCCNYFFAPRKPSIEKDRETGGVLRQVRIFKMASCNHGWR